MNLFTGGWDETVPPVQPITLAAAPRWERIVELPKDRPACMHCQLVRRQNRQKSRTVDIQRAAERRIGIDGSLLDLCTGHAAQQRDRDEGLDERAA